ncbi:uncharacterized protein LOC134438656 [Engraulis encrasicolus]|uniref:uncharacterized protein LOC134438656 n=1 Tax=Engraulis encrasicolus TaxID=184585 RepID=UPI002FD5CAB3
MENARHVVEDKCTVRDAASTGSSSGRPGVFPQGPALSRQTRPALTLIRTRQSPSSSGRAAVTPQPAPARTTTLTGLAHFQKEMEASISRLLQLTTDLEIATTLPSQSDNSDCAGPQVWTAFQPSLCEDRPLQVDSYDCKQKPKKHVDTPDAVVKSSPPPPPQGMINTPQSIPTSDNHTQISAQPPMTHGRQKPTEVTKVPGWSDGASRSSSVCGSRPVPPPSTSELLLVLRGLLDLIDQHWRGNFSLHLNPVFLGGSCIAVPA